jgi:tetratricopeptide (TPR) repeat protein
VLASDRNWVNAISILGVCKLFAGSIRELIPAQEKAIRLSPRDPYIGLYYSRIGLAHLLQSRTDEAIVRFEQALSANPQPPYVHANLAAAYALRGYSKRAAAELAEARMRFGDDRFSSIARLQASGYYGVPPIRLLFETTFFAGLRKAGVPEE